MVSECMCVCVHAPAALREWAYPSLVAQNILIYWLPVSPPRHLSLSPSLSFSLSPSLAACYRGSGDLRPQWELKKGREERESGKERKTLKAREEYPIWGLIQRPFNQGPYIIQIYELRSWPNQNLDLSVRMSIYKHLVVGSGGDLAGASILLGPAFLWRELDQG